MSVQNLNIILTAREASIFQFCFVVYVRQFYVISSFSCLIFGFL